MDSNPFDLILPFVPEIASHIVDPEITEICVNPNGTVYVERRGVMEFVGRGILDRTKLLYGLQRIARQSGEGKTATVPSGREVFPLETRETIQGA